MSSTPSNRAEKDGDEAPAAATSASSVPSVPSASSAPAASPDLPWYLKVDVPKHPTLVTPETVLPEVPANAPSMMAPLLSFVADDLGLDRLVLLDLRTIDPPAALGPDLLMLFGSARSERHLHVSADRLVRWFRSHGIHATADGLLGRNELKIKLRRKARRAKLLGNHGAPTGTGAVGEHVDDGISTQWVCLHGGVLARPTQPESSRVDEDGRVSGFGTASRGGNSTIVVQMFTEGKRRQLDLETLWSRALERSRKRQTEEVAAMERMEEEEEEEKEYDEAASSGALSPPSAGTGTLHASALSAATPGGSHTRAFSTSARRLATDSSSDIVARLTQPVLADDAWPELGRVLATSSDAKVSVLQELARYLDSLPREDALEALADPAYSTRRSELAPSDFARCAQYCLRDLSTADSWPFRAWVHASALRLGHPAYTLAGMGDLVQEMASGGLALTREQCVHLLGGIFARAEETEEDSLLLQTAVARQLLDTMAERGQPVLSNDVLVAMVAALARANQRSPAEVAAAVAAMPADAAPTAPLPPDRYSELTAINEVDGSLQTALEQLLMRQRHQTAQAGQTSQTSQLTCPSEPELRALLDAYATQNDWSRFWDAWRLAPRHGRPRSAALYAFLFRRVAATQHQARCIDALRWAVEEMLQEQPPVAPSGPVLTALMACLRVADPQAEAISRNLLNNDQVPARLANREFVRLLNAIKTMNR